MPPDPAHRTGAQSAQDIGAGTKERRACDTHPHGLAALCAVATRDEKARKRKPAHDISPVALEAVARQSRCSTRNVTAKGWTPRCGSKPGSAWSCRWSTSCIIDARGTGHDVEAQSPSPRRSPACSRRTAARPSPASSTTVDLHDDQGRTALRGVVISRKSRLFADFERSGDRAAFMYSLIVTAKMNGIDLQAWLTDALGRLPDLTASQPVGSAAAELESLRASPSRLTAAYAGCLPSNVADLNDPRRDPPKIGLGTARC